MLAQQKMFHRTSRLLLYTRFKELSRKQSISSRRNKEMRKLFWLEEEASSSRERLLVLGKSSGRNILRSLMRSELL